MQHNSKEVSVLNILGVSALYHDSAAALIHDGRIVAAAQEERFTRKKHDAGIPKNAIAYCIKEGKIESSDIDYVVFYDNSLLTLDRFMQNIIMNGDSARDLLNTHYQTLFSKKLWIHKLLESVIPSIGKDTKFLMVKHHLSHAASAFYPSPYERSIIMTLDGVGEWTTLSIGVGTGNKIELKEELKYPHSLGLLYSAFTYFCGFKVNSGDYKFMGLAPYGKPIYYDLIRDKIIDVKPDGSFRLNLDYFDYQNGRTMINEERMSALFGGGRRLPETRISKREMDIAASVQLIVEEVLLKLARHAKSRYGNDIENLVLAGGVALNCVANGRLYREQIFKHIWIQPAAGDAGGALGASLYVWYHVLNNVRTTDGVHDSQQGSYLGPQFSNHEIEEFLNNNHYPSHRSDNLEKDTALLLAEQNIIGFFQGRMEFGPRALGNRSIIADPRSEEMQARLNLKIKYRESFRPFAPSVLQESVAEYFELEESSPYMLLCAYVCKQRCVPFHLEECLSANNMDMLPVVRSRRSDIPAVTHVDYSARIQTVDGVHNPRYYQVIKEFKNLTGCGCIVNTSFNVRGEPIVCTPQDAYLCFMRSDMDVLILGDFILYKQEQPQLLEKHDWRKQYELD